MPRTPDGRVVDAPTCGSLFSGVGLLDIGLHLAGFQHAWLCESEPFRRDLLRARFPGVPVYDDIRTLRGQAAADTGSIGRERWPGESAEGRDAAQRSEASDHTGDRPASPGAQRVDLIAGGFPCKGASSAGKQNGFEHAETVLWHEMRRVIGDLQPCVVLVENVANILGMAAAPDEPPGSLWGTVLADLAALGFDARWDCVPAAAFGAPHLRDRVFCIATQSARADAQRNADQRGRADGRPDAAGGRDRTAADAGSTRLEGRDERKAEREEGGWPDTATIAQPAADAGGGRRPGEGRRWPLEPDERAVGTDDQGRSVAVDWGEYAPAIQRWEAIHGPAPTPLVRRMDDGNPDVRRLRARMDRSRLSALGDGVHVHVAGLVGRHIMDQLERTG